MTYDQKLMPGTKHCKCAVCGRYFTTEKNFEMHRKTVSRKPYRRECLDPHTLTNKKGKARLRLNAKGIWSSAEGAYIPGGAG